MTIRCSVCGNDGSAQTAREKVTCWVLSACGKGTMTSPRCITRTSVWECGECFAKRRFGIPRAGEEMVKESAPEVREKGPSMRALKAENECLHRDLAESTTREGELRRALAESELLRQAAETAGRRSA